MPRYVIILGDVVCPACGHVIDDRVEIRWGRVPEQYHLGETVRWRRDVAGNVLAPYTLFAGPDRSFNCGDPSFHNVLLLDVNIYRRELLTPCPECQTRMDGAVVTVNNDVFTSLELVRQGELDRRLGDDAITRQSEIFIVTDDGQLVPRPDWVDRPLGYAGDPNSPMGEDL